MEWFGLTLYGPADPIKDMMRPDYHEPEVQPDLYEVIAKGTKKGFDELLAELDVYIGTTDGYAYKSNDRLTRMRIKGIIKPVGPIEMCRYPGTDAMKFGYWMGNPALNAENWYKACTYAPRPCTDIGRFFDTALKLDKFFKF